MSILQIQIGQSTFALQMQSSGMGAALSYNQSSLAAAVQTAADRVQTGLDREAAAASAAAAAGTLADAATKSANLSDLTDPATARTNIGAASVAALTAVAQPVGTATYTLYTNEATGSDTLNDGLTAGTPFATVNRALAAVPMLTAQVQVKIVVTGNVTTSYRAAADMIRPALVYIDGIKIGRRTDLPSGVAVGGLVIDLSAATLKPGSTFTRGIYATGHCGSVAIVLGAFDPQAGTESLIVSHRGSYLHLSGGLTGAVVDGKGIASFGLITEAGGLMECVNVSAVNSTIDAQIYAGCVLQMSAPNVARSIGSVRLASGGYCGLTTGMTCSTSIVQRGGTLDMTGASGNPIIVAGSFDGQGGVVTGSYVNMTGTSASVVARAQQWKIDVFKFDCQLQFEGGSYILRGSTAYTTGTQSTQAIPVTYTPNTYIDNTSADWKGSSGLSPVPLDPSDRYQTVSVTANGQVISVRAVAGKRNVVILSAGASRTGCKLEVTLYGDATQTPKTATELVLLNNSGFTVQLINSAPYNLFGIINSSITLGTAAPGLPAASFIWQTTYGSGGGWYCVTPQPSRQTGWTAKSGTALLGAIATYAAGTGITAPTGGATVDTESRTAIGALITRLAAVEAALQNESQRGKGYEDALRNNGVIN